MYDDHFLLVYIFSNSPFTQSTKRLKLTPGVHKFFKNLGATSKFLVPVREHKESSMLSTHSFGVPCEPHCYLTLSVECI